MKRTSIFIAISSVALLAVLIIQVNWIFETAKVREEMFNEKAKLVLSRTTEALKADKETCRKIEACVGDQDASGLPAKLEAVEIHKIDSLFTHYMKFYNFHIGYSYEVLKPVSSSSVDQNYFANYIYNKPLTDAAGTGEIELKLIFPEKKEFILAEMGTMFIASVILILVVLVLFWRTVISLMKEKMISEHTTDFLNNMTHEFKTPLTNIALATRMMGKDSTGIHEDKIKHYSGIILEENEKLRLQVDQVLSMTALERGEIPLQKTMLDVHGLIRDSLRHMNIQIENRKGEIELNLDAGNSVILGDKTHLTNALSNLLDNAVKYSGGKPELNIHTSNRGQNILVVVSDKGIGIEKEYHQKVFDRFFRVPTGDVHEVKGFGLGLFYVKRIVELHGGTIELAVESRTGTSFIVTLPYAG